MKDIKIKKLKPMFTTVVTTLDVYEEDLIEDGIVVAPRGTVRLVQKVVAVGDCVRNVKEGDFVLVDYKNYIVRKFRENSLKESMEKMEDVPVLDIPKIIIDGKVYAKLQDRDIEGLVEEYEEYETEKSVKKKGLL